ncbi:MAG: iron(III) transport system ATP-binding protein [Streptosporangiaceae bacterium]|jgi:iron(III) transport system ATP-binding protein|nr:iron(III) transport system ATP-binding protein [Streptosporangiaceae bacterium]
MTQLAVTGLDKAFGSHQVLTGLDLEVPAGSLTAILGPSGSGKTTLLRVLAGFERADAGVVTIGSTVADGPGVHLAPERRRIGYVPQEGSLFPHLTVAANIGFGLPRRDRRGQRTADLLDAVGLTGLARRFPHQLSGGQQQRVALARALAIKPEIVLLDEPFASLDAHLRASVRADVQHLLREAGTTAVLVTHDQDEALSTADLVAVLRDGRIAQCDAPQDLYARPVDADMARFIGDANLVAGVLDGAVVDTLLGRLPVELDDGRATASGPVTVLVRPEQVELGPNGQHPGLTAGGLTGRVVGYGYHGHDAVVKVQPEQDPAAPLVIVRTLGAGDLPPGSLVILRARGPVRAWPQPGAS